jgi:hypothetical protein
MNHLAPFRLLSAPPGVCPECAVEHAASDPHDALSMTYQYVFFNRHGRFPTWADAMAHCDPVIIEVWTAILKEMGEWTEPRKAVVRK